MGTRPKKILGYGNLNLPVGSVNLPNLYKPLTEFYDWLKENHPKEFEDLWFLDEKTLKDYIYRLINGVSTQEDDDEPRLWNGQEGIVIVPPVLMDEAHQSDSAFVYAEIEKLFPETLNTLDWAGYNFLIPPYPTEYSVISKHTGEPVKHGWETYRYLRRLQEGNLEEATRIAKIAAHQTEFKTPEEVVANLELAPPIIIKLIAEYFNLFNDEDTWKTLTPTVLYYWN